MNCAIQATEFSGELYRIPLSVASNGSVQSLPPLRSGPSQLQSFPAIYEGDQRASVELSAIPIHGGLEKAYLLGLGFSIDSSHYVRAITTMQRADGIIIRPSLEGTMEQRLNQPELRPGDCNDCNSLSDAAYFAALNYVGNYRNILPRTGIESRPIPFEVSGGITLKYFLEELEGMDYFAQNFNADAGIAIRLFWGFNPTSRQSDRDILMHVNGFELLQSTQLSRLGDETLAEEAIASRFTYGLSWIEYLPKLKSRIGLGLQQELNSGSWPNMGIEWWLLERLGMRMGASSNRFAAGTSLHYRFVTLDYAIQYNSLASTLYQLSLQMGF